LGKKATRYKIDRNRRKKLLYSAKARHQAVMMLLKNELGENKDAKAILFHESIHEAMDLWYDLVKGKLPAVPENSELSKSVREMSVEQFRKGTAQILVSVKSLIEGFNVPSTDIGIIVASSTSVRQRIQTFGRVLRKHRTKSGEEKHAIIQVIYMDRTVDDVIYSKIDWDKLTGAARNRFYKWNVLKKEEPTEQAGPPRRPLPGDCETDESTLTAGEEYPGRYEGIEYSADSKGNIYSGEDKKEFASNPQGVPELINKVKKSYGRFKLTPNRRYILVRIPRGETWVTVYVEKLKEPFDFEQKTRAPDGMRNISDLKLGDVFPAPVPESSEEYGYSQKRGRHVIVKRIKKGEVYARLPDGAKDRKRGEQAEKLLDALALFEQELGERITKFKITPDLQAVVLLEGKWIYISSIESPLEFKEI